MTGQVEIVDKKIREQALITSKSFLVQAPAGSGKTSLLTKRFLSILADAVQHPEEILAITFTKKAAHEMRERILLGLELGTKEDIINDPYKKQYQLLARRVLAKDKKLNWSILENPNRLRIKTIDSLCANITQQMPIISRFGAQPDVLADAMPLYEKAVENILQEQDESIPWVQDLTKLLYHLDNNYESIMYLLTSIISSREQWLPHIMEATFIDNTQVREILEQGLKIAIYKAIEDVSAAIPKLDNVVFQWPANDITALAAWKKVAKLLLTEKNSWRKKIAAKQEQYLLSLVADASSLGPEDLKRKKDELKNLLEQLPGHDNFKEQLSKMNYVPVECYTDAQWEIVESLIAVLPVLVAQLKLVFQQTGQVDFQEISIAANYALGNINDPSDIALALDYKIQHILVDEFQDTSNAQFNFLQKLTQGWEPLDGRTIFLVGDPMQSIYSFRQAEVGIFLKIKAEGIGAIKLDFLQLQVNFRATAAIIQWVNKVFKSSFPKNDNIDYGAIAYTESITQHHTEHADNPVSINIFEKEQDNLEAQEIIALINQLKHTDPSLSIAILVRSRRHLTKILLLLSKEGISYQGVEIEKLHERPIIQDLLSLSTAILHLDDTIAWLSVLRSPLCGLELIDLHILAASEQPLWSTIHNPDMVAQLSADGKIRLARLLSVLDISIAQFTHIHFEKLIRETWYSLAKDIYSNSEDIDDAESFFDFIRQYEDDRNLFKLNFLSEKLDNLFKRPTFLDAQAVQIMTIHKSKGLEFDVVILPGLGKKPRPNSEQLFLFSEQFYNNSLSLLLAPIRASSEQQDIIYEYLKKIKHKKQLFELIRLFYVAVTRAKKQLYLFGFVKDGKANANSLLATIWPIINNSVVLTKTCTSESKQMASNACLKKIPQSLLQQVNKQPPPGCQEDFVFNSIEHQNNIMRHIGTVVHRIFWHIVVHNMQLTKPIAFKHKQQWSQMLWQLGVAKCQLRKATSLVEKAILNTIGSNEGLWLFNPEYPESYAEWELTASLSSQRQVFTGSIIDRAFLDLAGIFWIIDYKTCFSEDIHKTVATYTAQLKKYVTLVNRLRPNLTIKSGFYFPLQSKIIYC